jgi:hypothetical protein
MKHASTHASWRCSFALAALLGGTLQVNAAPAAGSVTVPIVYPAKGQTIEVQTRDEGECRSFAQQNSGFNPAFSPSQATAQSTGGGLVGGAARGAALGAIGGAIGGDAGKGAAIGAGVGSASGLLRSRRAAIDVNRQQQAIDQEYEQQRAVYHQAFGVCMQARGYAVN